MNTQVYWPCILAALKQGHFIHIGAFGGWPTWRKVYYYRREDKDILILQTGRAFCPSKELSQANTQVEKGGKCFT